ncbi:hypothetical protein HMPREF9005_1187 [Actinomyces sp. oral taxon 178 str. F0338]|nr:hypothetical protein HMPREF9005_1187 [Actinomyces sp. oral taxon 178 str. F0338]
MRGKLLELRAEDGAHGLIPARAGKTNPPGPDASDLGLIPARAGKTRKNSPGCYPRRAHPRACGENHGVGEA